MIENPEYRARLKRKLEKWPDGNGSPVTINEGLELIAIVEHQEITIKEWRRRFKNRGRKNKSLKTKVARLEKEADWLAAHMKCDNAFTPEQEAVCIAENGPCVKCLREAARRAVAGQSKS